MKVPPGSFGRGWREMNALPVPWFDELARVPSKVEEVGVWPEDLLDEYIVIILQGGW